MSNGWADQPINLVEHWIIFFPLKFRIRVPRVLTDQGVTLVLDESWEWKIVQPVLDFIENEEK